MEKWNSNQKRLVNGLTKPMADFVLDIAEVHDSDLEQMIEARDKLTAVIEENKIRYHVDVYNAITQEFEDFEDMKGDAALLGEFILLVCKERKYNTEEENPQTTFQEDNK